MKFLYIFSQFLPYFLSPPMGAIYSMPTEGWTESHREPNTHFLGMRNCLM